MAHLRVAVEHIHGIFVEARKTVPSVAGQIDCAGNMSFLVILSLANVNDREISALLDRVAEVPFLRLRGSARHAEQLKTHRDIALLSRQLATIACDAPLPADFGNGERRAVDVAGLDALFEQLRFGPLTRRRLQTAAAG